MIDPELRCWWCSNRPYCEWRRVSLSFLQFGKSALPQPSHSLQRHLTFEAKKFTWSKLLVLSLRYSSQRQKNILSGTDFFYPLRLTRIYYLEVLQVEMYIKISFDFQKPFTVKAEGISIILSWGSYHLSILLIKHCSINKQIIEVSREAVDLNHDSCSFIFVLTRQ